MKLPIPQRYKVTADPLRSERQVELLLLGLVLLLCLQLLYSGARFVLLSDPAAVPPAADALAVKDMASAARVSAAQSEEILARPLFWEGRRPLPENDVVAEKAVPRSKAGKLKGIKLLGVFGGDTAGIIVQVKDKKRRILSGEEINGWTLESVQPNEVVFSANGRTESLQLRPGTISAVQAPKEQVKPAAQSPVKRRVKAQASPAPGGDTGEDQLSLGGAPGR